MALPPALQALYDKLSAYNSDAYSASTNPGGFARGGNQKPVDNFIKSIRDFIAYGKGISDLTTTAADNATQTAADRVQTGLDRTAASNSATAAAQSATDAAGSVTAAAAIYDNFDDRYLGAKSAAPTKDNDGDNLIVGALYFSTPLGSMQVWNGNAWQAPVPAAADYALKARQITAGAGLTGGGDLSADRSFTLDLPSQAEAEAGTNNAKPMTPLRVKQAVAAQSPVPGLVFISAQTVASPVAAVDFTGLNSAYDEFVVCFENVVPSTEQTQLVLRTSADNGSTFESGSSSYGYAYREDLAASSTGAAGGSTGIDSARICGSGYGVSATAALSGASGETTIYRPSSTNENKQIRSSFLYTRANVGDGGQVIGITGAHRNSASAINAIRFMFNAGNIKSGSFKLYGRRKV